MLTGKQLMFVTEYIKDRNATQAAIRAGYSRKTAKSVGSENLTKPDIAEAIETATRQVEVVARRTAADVLKDIETITEEAHESGDLKTALHGLELQGKHLGMFKEKVENELSGGFTVGWDNG